jgi:ribosomal protein S27E
MIKLYQYFGVIGMASILFWVMAGSMLLIYARHPRRHIHYFRVLAIALLAYVLAQINSDQVSAIQTDRTEQIDAARLQQQQLREEEAGLGNVRVRFAEDTTRDRLDIAGITTNEARALTGEANSSTPAYRQKGKQTRETGKKQLLEVDNEKEDVAKATDDGEKPLRMMKEDDVLRANRLDRYNLLIVNLLLWLSAVAFAGDYLWRFNQTFVWYFPLPISGAWIDHFFHKFRTVLLLRQKENLWKEFLEGVVRKGESFIYFGDKDLWPSELPRLDVCGKGLFPLHKILYGTSDAPQDAEFSFDSAWFGRYCVVVVNSDAAYKLTRELVDYLNRRHATRATARQTVNVVWDLRALPDENVIKKLAVLVRETNFRFILSASDKGPDWIVQYFDEIYPEGIARPTRKGGAIEFCEQKPKEKPCPKTTDPEIKSLRTETRQKEEITSKTPQPEKPSRITESQISSTKTPSNTGASTHKKAPIKKVQRPPEKKPAESSVASCSSSPATPSGFTFTCPHCHQNLSAEASWVGMEVSCPLCATALVVPQPGLQPPAPSTSTPSAEPHPEQRRTTFSFACPKCRQVLTAQTEWCGMEVKCPLCGETIVTPPAPSTV